MDSKNCFVVTPKRKASGSNPLRNARHHAESLDLIRLSAFMFKLNLQILLINLLFISRLDRTENLYYWIQLSVLRYQF